MAFTFAAFSYICALVLDAFLIFFSIFHVSIHLKFYRHFVSDRSVRRFFHSFSSLLLNHGFSYLVFLSLQIIAFDELKTDYKNPIDQCSSLNPVRITLRMPPSVSKQNLSLNVFNHFLFFNYSASSTWILYSHILQLNVSNCGRMVYTHVQYSTNCLSHS
jgi:hypothetical protein